MKFATPSFSHIREVLGSAHEPETMCSLARLYWSALIFCSLIVALLSIAWGVMQMNAVSAATAPPALSGSLHPAVPLDRSKFQAVVQGFSARADRYQALKTQPPQVADPSN